MDPLKSPKIDSRLFLLAFLLVAVSLWALCPVFNLESNLVHLDFPMTFFILAGVWYLIDYRENQFDLKKLVLSGVAVRSRHLPPVSLYTCTERQVPF